MKILLCNDDGYEARGLLVLYAELLKYHEVTIVAPSKNCSGMSSSLTLRQDVRVEQKSENLYVLDGTPSDCVHFAVNGLLDFQPDIVVSGINNGENLGDDVIYSGTVAAAIEGRFQYYPAIAVSLLGPNLIYYETAARVTVDILNRLLVNPSCTDLLYNINVPDVVYSALQGVEITRLGDREKSETIIKQSSNGNISAYRIGTIGMPRSQGLGTDFYAVKRNRVSVTPLSTDMTSSKRLSKIQQYLV